MRHAPILPDIYGSVFSPVPASFKMSPASPDATRNTAPRFSSEIRKLSFQSCFQGPGLRYVKVLFPLSAFSGHRQNCGRQLSSLIYSDFAVNQICGTDVIAIQCTREMPGFSACIPGQLAKGDEPFFKLSDRIFSYGFVSLLLMLVMIRLRTAVVTRSAHMSFPLSPNLRARCDQERFRSKSARPSITFSSVRPLVTQARKTGLPS